MKKLKSENLIDPNILIKLENVSLMFNLTTEKVDNIKEYFIRLIKGKLRFQKFMVLNDINLEVKRGESLGLIGKNGCGKSTLLKLIAGVLEPTKGKVTIQGSIAPLINLGAGFDMEANAIENIYLNGAILGFSRKEMKEKIPRIIDFAELAGFVNVPIKNYSSGMLSRLGFSIAVDVQPDILLVDEVLSVGDENFRIKCLNKIQQLKANGTTVVFVSHSMPEVLSVCDKCLWVKDGKINEYGDAEIVSQNYLKYCEELRNQQ